MTQCFCLQCLHSITLEARKTRTTRLSRGQCASEEPNAFAYWRHTKSITKHKHIFFFFSFKIYNLKVCFRCWLVSITIKKEAEEEERWKKESSNLLLSIVVKIMMSVVSLGIWGSGCYGVASNNVSWWFCYVLCVSYIDKKINPWKTFFVVLNDVTMIVPFLFGKEIENDS